MQGPAIRPNERPLPLPTKMCILICAIAVLAGCGSTAEDLAEPAEEPLPTIKAAVWTVEPRPWPTIVFSQGSLVADEIAIVGAKVAGRVAEVHVDLGDFVAAGGPLVTLDQEEFQLQVSQAEAQLAQARSAIGLKEGEPVDELKPETSPPVRQEKAVWDEAKAKLERIKRLRSESAITQAEYDQIEAAERVAEARYESALNSVQERIALVGVRQAELSLAQQRLQDAAIGAPFDGLVLQRQVAPGAYVQVGDPIATVVRTNPLRFRGTIPERHAQHLVVGQQMQLQIESVEEPRTACVTRISPSLDQLTRSLLYEAEVDNDDRSLRTGLFAEAQLVIDPDAEALVVPHSALVEFAGTEKVWKVVDGVTNEQEVLTGQRRPQGIEILQGLSAGDVILSESGQGRAAKIEPLPAARENDSIIRNKESAVANGEE